MGDTERARCPRHPLSRCCTIINRSVCRSGLPSFWSKSRACRPRLPRGACPHILSPPLCSRAAMMLVSKLLYPWAESKINVDVCSSPSFLHATTADSGCQLLVFGWMCVKELFDSGVRPNPFPQKHTRQVIPLRDKIFPVCELRVLSESAAATHTTWPFGRFTAEKQMLLRCATSRAFRRPRCVLMKRSCRSRSSLFPGARVFELRCLASRFLGLCRSDGPVPAFHVARKKKRGTTTIKTVKVASRVGSCSC